MGVADVVIFDLCLAERYGAPVPLTRLVEPTAVDDTRMRLRHPWAFKGSATSCRRPSPCRLALPGMVSMSRMSRQGKPEGS